MMTPSQDTLYINPAAVGFVMDTYVETRSKFKKGTERPSVRHEVQVTYKMYPEEDDCCSDCCSDPFCKCGWDAEFVHRGRWGETLEQTLSAVTERLNVIGRCQQCKVANVCSQGLCPSCAIKHSLPPSEEQQCPVCLNASPKNHQVPLVCTHRLCTLCARRLYMAASDEYVACPCCRAKQSKPSLAHYMPPAPVF